MNYFCKINKQIAYGNFNCVLVEPALVHYNLKKYRIHASEQRDNRTRPRYMIYVCRVSGFCIFTIKIRILLFILIKNKEIAIKRQ